MDKILGTLCVDDIQLELANKIDKYERENNFNIVSNNDKSLKSVKPRIIYDNMMC